MIQMNPVWEQHTHDTPACRLCKVRFFCSYGADMGDLARIAHGHARPRLARDLRFRSIDDSIEELRKMHARCSVISVAPEVRIVKVS